MKNWLVRVVLVVTALGACGAVQARYLQSDPIGLHGGFNPFIYRDANPLIYADPLGLLISSTVGGVRHGTTLTEAATFGAPGNVGVATGIAGSLGGAAASAADAGYRWLLPTPARMAVGIVKGLSDHALPPPSSPQPPVLARPAIVRPGGFEAPAPPPAICPRVWLVCRHREA